MTSFFMNGPEKTVSDFANAAFNSENALVFDGNEVIDLGRTVNQGDWFEFCCSWSSASSGIRSMVMGNTPESQTYIERGEYGGVGCSGGGTVSVQDDQKVVIRAYDGGQIYANDVLTYASKLNFSNYPTLNLAIGNLTVQSFSNWKFYGSVFWFNWYDSQGNRVMKLRPRSVGGVAGLYDIMNGCFKTQSLGTGTIQYVGSVW